MSLKPIKGGNETYKYKGYCKTCDKDSTFNESRFCNSCYMHYESAVNQNKNEIGSFTAEDILSEKDLTPSQEDNQDYEPQIPKEIIDNLTGKNQEKINPYKNTKKKFKKENVMKKSFKNLGKGIAKGTCKVLGGLHFGVQTTADVIAVSEAMIRERVFDEDKQKAFLDRKAKTVERQERIVEKLTKNQQQECARAAS